MLTISPVFNDFLRRRAREWLLKVDINGVEYGPRQVVDIQIENDIVPGSEFELGTAIISRCVLRLRTVDTIPPNAKVIPYVALSLEGLTWEEANYAWQDADFAWDGSTGTDWLPLGTFFIDNRRQQNKVWTFECYDVLTFADVAYVSQLSYPATMQAVWNEVCAQTGLTYDAASIQFNPSYTVPVAPTGYTCRQVLGYIAGAHGASVYAGRDGRLRWRKYAAAESPVYDMTEADYIRVKQTNPPKVYTKIVVTYDPDEQLTYEAGSGTENETLYLVNPLMTQQMVNNLLSQINGFSYVPIEMDARGYPQLEHGDRISFDRTESMSWLEADVAWDAADFPWDGVQTHQTLILRQTFTFKGGLGMSLEAPSKSEQQSEFPVQGTLTDAINRLNRNAVKQNKTYYGVTISPDYGLKVGRSDGLAEVVLNADEFRFRANGSDALWFDVPNLRWKFTGTLEGADGVFSGTIQGGQFVGGSITIGSGNNVFRADTQGIWAGNANFNSAPFRVDMYGAMTATNANITGTITGSTIVGGFINGTEISGGVITGSLIQTSASGSYPRIEFNSTGRTLKAEYSEINYISLEAFAPDIPYAQLVFFNEVMSVRHSAGTAGGTIQIYPGGTYIISNGSAAIQISSNMINLIGDVRVNGTPI